MEGDHNAENWIGVIESWFPHVAHGHLQATTCARCCHQTIAKLHVYGLLYMYVCVCIYIYIYNGVFFSTNWEHWELGGHQLVGKKNQLTLEFQEVLRQDAASHRSGSPATVGLERPSGARAAESGALGDMNSLWMTKKTETIRKLRHDKLTSIDILSLFYSYLCSTMIMNNI